MRNFIFNELSIHFESINGGEKKTIATGNINCSVRDTNCDQLSAWNLILQQLLTRNLLLFTVFFGVKLDSSKAFENQSQKKKLSSTSGVSLKIISRGSPRTFSSSYFSFKQAYGVVFVCDRVVGMIYVYSINFIILGLIVFCICQANSFAFNSQC